VQQVILCPELLLREKSILLKRSLMRTTLMIVVGNPLPEESGRVEEETKPLPVAIQQHHGELTFDIVGMATHEIVLRIPGLKQHNPEVTGSYEYSNLSDVITQFTFSLRIGSVRWWIRDRVETPLQDANLQSHKRTITTSPTRQTLAKVSWATKSD
jgi:hypothetical protein